MSLSKRLQKAQKRQQSSQAQLQTLSQTKGKINPTSSSSTLKRENSRRSSNLMTRHWHCIGASVRGTKAIISESPCQDYHCYKYLPTGELVVAVADGAGSASQADVGAYLACEAAVERLQLTLKDQKMETDEMWHGAICTAFDAAVTKLLREAQVKKIAVHEFATTLILMVFTPDLVVGGMVGDGTGIIKDAKENIFCIFTPQKGEYANQAYFLTAPQVLNRIEVQCVHSPLHCVALLTDGLIRLSCNTLHNHPHAGFFNPLFKFCGEAQDHAAASEELANWLNSNLINQRTDDDKTLVLVVRKHLSEEENLNNEHVRSRREDVQTRSRNRQRRTRKANKNRR